MMMKEKGEQKRRTRQIILLTNKILNIPLLKSYFVLLKIKSLT
jgi:hypothetical protein